MHTLVTELPPQKLYIRGVTKKYRDWAYKKKNTAHINLKHLNTFEVVSSEATHFIQGRFH